MARVFRDPHVVLACGAAVVVASEAAYVHSPSDAWLGVEVVAAALALLHAWRTQDGLRLVPLLALVVGFNLAYVAVHLGFDLRSDFDSRVLYRRYGERLLDGHYPRAEYPPGAVFLFALEAWIGNGSTRVANAFVMVPFAALLTAAVWLFRTPRAAWLAAVAGLFPLNMYYWEFKFDLVPAALLVSAVLLARRDRWGWAGLVLAAGALVKWTPALAFLVFAAALAASRERRALARHVAAFVVTVAAVYVPLLLWNAHAVLGAYERQGGRTITAESVWFLPLHWAGLADVHGHISYSAHAPGWANTLASLTQLAVVVVIVLLALRVHASRRAVLSLAALAPGAFLLVNRIYSPQFILVVLAGWLTAAALLVPDRRRQLAVGVAAAAASVANAFVYPYALPHYTTTWQVASFLLFAIGLALTAWLAASAARDGVVLRAEREPREATFERA